MKDISYNFKGKHAVVVGGSYGIGAEVVRQFEIADCKVSYISRTKNIDSYSTHLKCDITSFDSLSDNFKKFNKIDFLINVAAINFCKKISDIDLNEWESVINTNLTSYYYTTKLAIEKMGKGSRIVNYSSIAGRNKSIVSGVHYTSSKAGIIGMTRQLAQELGEKGINVNCICPSQTLTPMLEKSMTQKEVDNLSKKIPLGRIATTYDQAAVALFLCSSASSYINGSIIDVNGGQL